MRLVTYRSNGVLRPGLELDGEIADVQSAAEVAGWDDKARASLGSGRHVAGLGPERLRELRRAVDGDADRLRSTGALRPSDGVPLGPPVPIRRRSSASASTTATTPPRRAWQPPDRPMFFAKFANSLVGPADEIVPPPVATAQVDYEAELAVVIGRRARDIAHGRRARPRAGAMAFNDVSARDLQLRTTSWTGGKAIDTFGPCGPRWSSREDIEDPRRWLSRPGQRRDVQDGNTAS